MNNISIEESNSIKGLAILIVMIHHFEQSTLSIDYMSIFNAMGPIACSAFFFISGYGLSKSKSEKTLSYWVDRVKKIFVPFILANLLYLLYYKSHQNLNLDLLLYVIGIKLINGHCWFLQVLLIMYVGYAIGSRFRNTCLCVLLSFIAGFIYTVLNNAHGSFSWLSFPMGILFANNNINKFIKLNLCSKLIIFCVLIVSFAIYRYNNYFLNKLSLVGNFIMMVLSAPICFLSISSFLCRLSLFKYLGRHSMDYYLIHGLCLILLSAHKDLNTYVAFILYCILVFVAASIFGFVTKKILTIGVNEN